MGNCQSKRKEADPVPPEVCKEQCSMSEVAIWVLTTRKEWEYFVNMNSKIEDFAAFPDARMVGDMDSIMSGKMRRMDGGVMMSRSTRYSKIQRGGTNIHASLSHEGIFAVCSKTTSWGIELTDLISNRRCKMSVKGCCCVGFYDSNILILLDGDFIRECSVQRAFDRQDISATLRVGEVEDVCCFSDVSRLHMTRLLQCRTMRMNALEFNVDTRVFTNVLHRIDVFSFATLTGIDVGVKGLFNENERNKFVHTLETNGTHRIAFEHNPMYCHLLMFIPSASNPRNVTKGLKLFSNGQWFVDDEEGFRFIYPISCPENHSIVRLYQDIFIAYDENVNKWCLLRIIVP